MELRKAIDLLSEVLLAIAGFALVMMLLHVGADVAGKYLFNRPVPGTIHVVAWYYMVAVAFLPIAYVQIRREHLMVELFTMNLSATARAWIDLFVASCGALYSGLLAYLVLLDAMKATARREYLDVSLFDLVVWPARWILPVSFALTALVFLLQVVSDLRDVGQGWRDRTSR